MRSSHIKPNRNVGEHPRDVIAFVAAEQQLERACALAIVTSVEGPSSRAVGSMMGVSSTGEYAGYISNGCIDAAAAEHALGAINESKMKKVRYGAGSPFMDLKLPCGGALDLLLLPNPDRKIIAQAAAQLTAREETALSISENGVLKLHLEERALFKKAYAPPLRIAVAGRGAETLAFIRIASAAPYDLAVYSPDDDILELASTFGAETARLFPDQPIDWPDDPYTAITLLFHEHEWETTLLKSAIETHCFFIGAMGSRRTHAARCEALLAAGASPEDAARVKGQIGLIPSARDAATLGVSVLAQIVDSYHKTAHQRVLSLSSDVHENH